MIQFRASFSFGYSALPQPALPPLTRHWPVFIVASVPALLPVARLVELPLLIMAVVGLVDLARGARPSGLRLYLILFGCYWVPQLLSCVDSADPEKSWTTIAGQLRFLPAGVFVLHRIEFPRRNLLLGVTAALVIWWALDALVQAVAGINTLGMPRSAERLNGVFGSDNIKLGHVLAVLSPLALEWLRARGLGWTTLGFALLACVILLIGTRSAWIMFAVVVGCYLYVLWRHSGLSWIKNATAIMVLVSLIGFTSYHVSDQFRDRVDRSLQMLEGDTAAVNYALSRRLPIWETALNMASSHWINGVGTRAFRDAYPSFASDDDPWINGDSGAHHAHQLLLEVITETGLIGLLGLALGCIAAAQAWLRRGANRYAALPFAVALAGMIFPINTHLAFFSTFWSIVFWWLIMLYVAALDKPTEASPL